MTRPPRARAGRLVGDSFKAMVYSFADAGSVLTLWLMMAAVVFLANLLSFRALYYLRDNFLYVVGPLAVLLCLSVAGYVNRYFLDIAQSVPRGSSIRRCSPPGPSAPTWSRRCGGWE